MKVFIFSILFIFLMLSCDDTTDNLLDKCKDVTCSEHGSCAIDTNSKAVCICETNFHAEDLECIADEGTPCEDITTCDNNGSCAVNSNNEAVCVCEIGFHADGLKCVVDVVVNPCENVTTCDTNGSCAVNSNNEAICVCEIGFHADGLKCIADVVINPCEGITTCDTNGVCAVNSDNEAICACNPGFQADGLKCIKTDDLCEGVTCGGEHNSCVMGECECDHGYSNIDGSCMVNMCGTDDDAHEIMTVTGNFYDFVKPCTGVDNCFNYTRIDYLKPVHNPNEKYRVPTQEYITAFKAATKALIKGDICLAEEKALLADMKLFKFVDTGSSLDSSIFTNEYICMIGKDEAEDEVADEHDASYFRGLFCMRNYIETNTYTRDLHIAIPHPLKDANTNLEGAKVFQDSGAKYFSIATAHRCSNDTPSSCAGETAVCSSSHSDEAFKISDMGHNSDSLFFYFGTQIQDLDTSYHFQIHGFGEDSHPNRVAVATIGSEDVKVKADRIIRRFTKAINDFILLDDASSDREVISCNDASVPSNLIKLCATTNPLGRYINGIMSPSLACTHVGEAVSFAHSRFIHLEQTRWIRGEGIDGLSAVNNRFHLVVDAVNKIFPAKLQLESIE